MPDDVVIAKLKKNPACEIWVVSKEYKGTPLIDIREYFYSSDGPAWLPTKKGVSFTPDLLGQVVDASEEMANRDKVGEVRVISRGDKTQTRFSICEYQKHVYGEIRTYYVEKAGSLDWKPGKGVTLRLAMLGELVGALRLAEDLIEHRDN